MWEGKYIQEILKISYLKGQAVRELGPKYPLATRPAGTIELNGADGLALEKLKEKLTNEQMIGGNFELNIFIGLNKNLDMYSFSRFAYFLQDNQNWKINFVFRSSSALAQWKKQYTNFFPSKYFEKANMVIQPKAFKDFDVYTTPSIFLKDKKLNKDTLIFVGKMSQKDVTSRVIEYMIQNEYIKRNDLTASKAWQSDTSEEVVEKYYRRNLGVEYEK